MQRAFPAKFGNVRSWSTENHSRHRLAELDCGVEFEQDHEELSNAQNAVYNWHLPSPLKPRVTVAQIAIMMERAWPSGVRFSEEVPCSVTFGHRN